MDLKKFSLVLRQIPKLLQLSPFASSVLNAFFLASYLTSLDTGCTTTRYNALSTLGRATVPRAVQHSHSRIQDGMFRHARSWYECFQDFFLIALTENVLESNGPIPTLTTFVPSLPRGSPFRASVHSWDIPKLSPVVGPWNASGVKILIGVRVIIDGICLS